MQTEIELAFRRGGMVFVGLSANNIDRIDVLYELVEKLQATLHISVYNASLLKRLADAGGFDPSHVVNHFATSPCVHVFERSAKELDASPAGGPGAFEGRRHLVDDYRDAAKNLQHRVVSLLFGGDLELLGKILPHAGSKYIHAACEPFDDNMQIESKRLQAWLDYFQISYHQIHTSGHIYGAQLKRAIQDIAPAFILPIHTEHPELFRDVLPEEGRWLDGRPSGPGGPPREVDLGTLSG